MRARHVVNILELSIVRTLQMWNNGERPGNGETAGSDRKTCLDWFRLVCVCTGLPLRVVLQSVLVSDVAEVGKRISQHRPLACLLQQLHAFQGRQPGSLQRVLVAVRHKTEILQTSRVDHSTLVYFIWYRVWKIRHIEALHNLIEDIMYGILSQLFDFDVDDNELEGNAFNAYIHSMQYLSSLLLNIMTYVELTTFSGKLFQTLTTRRPSRYVPIK